MVQIDVLYKNNPSQHQKFKMLGHYSHPHYCPGFGEQRPKLFFPFNFLTSTSLGETKRLLILFYDRFRCREVFDNYFSDNKRPPAPLDGIYECYVEGYIKTVNELHGGDSVLTFAMLEKVNIHPMELTSFAQILKEYDDEFQQTRQVNVAPAWRMKNDPLPLWNKYDKYGDIKHLIEKSPYPVIKIDHSSRATDMIVNAVLGVPRSLEIAPP
jgi:hypothetical protein